MTAHASLTAQPHLPVPVGNSVAGRYRILKCLARGKHCCVCQAHDQVADKAVALKLIAAGSVPQPAIAELKQQPFLSRKLAHPNFVRVFDTGECEGLFFVSMELIDGAELASLIRGGRGGFAAPLPLGFWPALFGSCLPARPRLCARGD